ncbi:nickel/cobalt transporter [Aestuariivirga sp.]|uniref:nickel/cobalt transporter n=1 Tax=Aestuariivirga sp. TaxID=2650926 RepID=UPI003BAAE02D
MQGVRRALLGLMALFMLCLAAPPPSFAQTSNEPAATQAAPPVKIDRRKLLVQPRNKDGTVEEVPFFEDPVLWARDKQQNFYSRLSATLRAMKGQSALAAGWTLMLLSFAYGIFHAAGPGHGKAVISTWLLATESELKRGVLISFLSAIIQALTAIVLVSVLFFVVASVGSTARNVAGVLESASYGLIALLGVYLIWTAMGLFAARRAVAATRPAIAGMTTHQSVALGDFAGFEPMRREAVAADHLHGPDCGCGHAHLPAAKDVSGEWSLAKAFSLAFAVGIRPCTGAILVLVFANGLGLFWAGVASTFAMALGTFITVSAIAAIAVYAKRIAARVVRGNSRLMDWLGIGLRLGGGLAIAFLGTILFLGSLGTSNAMM